MTQMKNNFLNACVKERLVENPEKKKKNPDIFQNELLQKAKKIQVFF